MVEEITLGEVVRKAKFDLKIPLQRVIDVVGKSANKWIVVFEK